MRYDAFDESDESDGNLTLSRNHYSRILLFPLNPFHVKSNMGIYILKTNLKGN